MAKRRNGLPGGELAYDCGCGGHRAQNPTPGGWLGIGAVVATLGTIGGIAIWRRRKADQAIAGVDYEVVIEPTDQVTLDKYGKGTQVRYRIVVTPSAEGFEYQTIQSGYRTLGEFMHATEPPRIVEQAVVSVQGLTPAFQVNARNEAEAYAKAAMDKDFKSGTAYIGA